MHSVFRCFLIFGLVAGGYGNSELWSQQRVIIKKGIGFKLYDYSGDTAQNNEGKKSVPVLYFHGTSSSKREPDLFIEQLQKKKRLLISFDRPGYGDSRAETFSDLDDYLKWVDNKLFPALHEILEYEPKQFDIVSVSGGASYSLKLAQAKPEKIRKLSLLSAGLFAHPVGQEGNYERARRLAANRPRIAEWIVKASRVNVDLTQAMSTKKLSPPDKAFANCRKELAKALFVEATKCGAAGIVQDSRLQLCDTSYAKPIPKQIKCEFWNGSCDYTISVASAKLLSEKTGIELKVIQNEGHLSSLPISFENSVLSAEKPE